MNKILGFLLNRTYSVLDDNDGDVRVRIFSYIRHIDDVRVIYKEIITHNGIEISERWE